MKHQFPLHALCTVTHLVYTYRVCLNLLPATPPSRGIIFTVVITAQGAATLGISSYILYQMEQHYRQTFAQQVQRQAVQPRGLTGAHSQPPGKQHRE